MAEMVPASVLTENKTKRISKQQRKFFWAGVLFVLPWIIGFICFQIYPIGSAVYYSFTDFNIFNAPNWAGFDNYINLFKDNKLYLCIGNTAYMAFLGLPIGLIAALMIALLLNTRIKGMAFFRTIYYMPSVVPMVASAMLFIWVLNPEYGLVNSFFNLLGLKGPAWLSDPKYTKLSLILMDTWRCGQSAIIFLSALMSVPASFYEAADIDGAGSFRKFINITLPCISPAIQFLVIMGLIQSFQYFTQGFVFAQAMNPGQTATGGPKNSLLFYSLYLYQNAFSFLKMGYASAMAIILFIIVMAITFFVLRASNKSVNYDME